MQKLIARHWSTNKQKLNTKVSSVSSRKHILPNCLFNFIVHLHVQEICSIIILRGEQTAFQLPWKSSMYGSKHTERLHLRL